MKKRVVAVFLAVLMGMSVTACSGQEEVQEVNSVSVSGIFPETGDVIVTNTYIGTVAPKESITVYPMKSGNVTEVSVAVGKQVKAGDVLFKMDSKEADVEVADAEAELEKAEELAEQAKEDAEALEEALIKVEGANEKAVLETELKALQKDLEAAEKERDDAQDVYDTKKYEYNRTSSTDDKLKDEKKESMNLALDLLNDAKADVKKIEEEIKELETQIKALDTANKSTTKTTSTTKSTSKTTTSTSSSTKKTDDEDSDSKDSDSKTSTTKTTDSVEIASSVYEQMVLDAKQKVEEAKAKLELYQITAPIDGTIEAVYIETNEKAFEDSPCLVLSNKSNIEVTFQVAEAAAMELKTGDKVKVEKNGAMNEATITEVAIMADEQTKLFTVKASLGAVTGFATGTDVKVYAETRKAQGVMKLPYDTLYFQGDTAYVYCAVDDEAVRRPVQVGLMNEEYVQILDGLTEEDIVISTWSSQLKDGTDIDLLFVIGGNTVDGATDDAADETTEGTLDQSEDDTETENSEDTEEEYKWVLPELD